MTDIVLNDFICLPDSVVKGRQAQLFRVLHFNPAGIALTSFLPLNTSTLLLDRVSQNHDHKQHLLIHNFRVIITNIGSLAGDNFVRGFISPLNQTINDDTSPIKQLFGFKRVHLNVNETIQVFFFL